MIPQNNFSAHDKKFLSNWQDRRKKGKWNFVLTEGIAFFLLMSLFVGVTSYFIMRDEVDIWKYLLIQTLLFIPAGILYAFFMWFIFERKYRKLTSH